MPDPISWSASGPYYIIALVGGYLLGSIPFGLILTKLAGLGDIRAIGSGNIGATNVLRTGHKGLAAATLLLDALKGAAAVLLIGHWWPGGPDAAICAGAGAFIGHLFPVWLKFKGGKGVATMLGIFFGLYWPLGLFAIVVWLITAFAFRYSSLSALIAAAASPVFAWFLINRQIAEFCLFLAVLVWWRHAANIKRLLKGEESSIRLSSSKPAGS
ncbi:MAG: glycerol-3-phosphate 1-O-acyltransferase PlsY [Dongiaceae bacterium]